MYLSLGEYSTFRSAFARQRNVVLALMLRNIRTRFFSHGFGFLVAIGWPLAHILVIIFIFAFSGRVAPYGDSAFIFVATGAIPFMTFSYLSRFMQITAVMTRPLMSFPDVKTFDILLAAAILETLSACLVTIILIILGWSFGLQIVPKDIVEATYAFGSALLLGLGFGVMNTVIALAVPTWIMIYVLMTILLWATAGVFFVPSSLPEPYRSIIAYHPALQSIEWMRTAYFEGYNDQLLDRYYVLEVGLGSLVAGLVLERLMRGYLLSVK